LLKYRKEICHITLNTEEHCLIKVGSAHKKKQVKTFKKIECSQVTFAIRMQRNTMWKCIACANKINQSRPEVWSTDQLSLQKENSNI